ncbi:MAG: hypothetical protein U5O39_03810 [Gammaproteobacteria bacterium]|nr:hypothetical protein [Gammaproteobacteria bacterium]
MEVRGHELEVEAVPFDFLRLRASLSHLNADYLNYSVPDLAGGEDPIDRSGLTPAQAPTDMFTFSGVYTTGFRDGTLRFYAGYRHTKEYTSNSIVPAARIRNFSMIDLSVDYIWRDWTFRLFSRNSNGKRFVTNVHRPLASQVVSLAPNTTSTLPIATTGDLDEPEFTGLQVIFVPPLGR